MRRRSPTGSPRGGTGPSTGAGCSATVGTDSWPTSKIPRHRVQLGWWWWWWWGERGVGRFSSHLHGQHAQEPQRALQAGRLRPCADGLPQRLPLSTQSVYFRLDHNAELACRDPAPHHYLEVLKVPDLENGSGSTVLFINSQGTQRTCAF